MAAARQQQGDAITWLLL